MATKTLKIEESTARKLYKEANSELKTILEESFGKEFFSQKITDIVKTWQDILNITGLENEDILPYSKPVSKGQRSLNAIAKIQKISEVLNEGWKPDFTNRKEYKYYPYFERNSAGWSVHSGFTYDCCHAVTGFGFYFKSSELALYAGSQFIDIYRDYLPE